VTPPCLTPFRFRQAWTRTNGHAHHAAASKVDSRECLQWSGGCGGVAGRRAGHRPAGDLSQIASAVPNLNFTTATQSSRSSFVSSVFIRGVGQPDFIVTTDPGVGIYVDGIYYGRTTGGVAELTYGRFDRTTFRGTLNIPFTDELQGRFAVSTRRSNGLGVRLDFATGAKRADLGEDDSLAARARLRWRPGDRFEANLAIDGTRVREPQVPDDIQAINPAAPLLGLWNALVGGPNPYTPAFLTAADYTSYATGPGTAELDLWETSLTLDWDLGSYQLKSITAYRDIQALFSNDGDGSPLRVLGSDMVDLDQDQLSQELQLSGRSFGDRLDWLAGLYYFDESAFEITHAYVMPGIWQVLESLPFLMGPAGPIGPCPPPPGASQLPTPGPLGCTGNPNNIPLDLDFCGTNDVQVSNYAAFAHGTYACNDRWSATAGLRYTHERKVHTLLYQRFNSGYIIAPPGTRTTRSWDAVTPKAGLEFRPSDQVMWYLSASRGFRSGGFNGRPFYRDVVEAFDPEYLWSYELRVKSTWFERRLVANTAIFHNRYSDVQLTANRATADGNVGVFTENGGKARIEGFELELHARPVAGLDFTAAIGYIDAQFTHIDPGVSVTLASVFPKTPKWNGNFSVQYAAALADFGSLTLRGDYACSSRYYNDVINTPGLAQSAFGLVNARIALRGESQSWEVAVFDKNLTDEHYITAGVDGLAAIGFNEAQYTRPREWGVALTYRL